MRFNKRASEVLRNWSLERRKDKKNKYRSFTISKDKNIDFRFKDKKNKNMYSRFKDKK